MQEEFLESVEFYHRRYHNFSSLLIVPVILLLIFVVGFTILAKKEMTISTTATVEASRVLGAIQSTSNHSIVGNYLVDNKQVKVGDLLLTYKSGSEETQEKTLSDQLNLLKEQKDKLELLKKSLETGRDQFSEADKFGYWQMFEDYQNQASNLTSQTNQQNTTIASQNASSSNTQLELGNLMEETAEKLADYQELKRVLQSGYSLDNTHALYAKYQALKKSGERENSLGEIDAQISQLESSLAGYRVQYAGSGSQQAYTTNLLSQLGSLKAQYLVKVGQELTVLTQQILEIENKLKQQVDLVERHEIRALNDGILHLNPEVVGANMVAEGTVLAQLYPEISKERKVNIVAYLSSKDIAGIKQGQLVRFSVIDEKHQRLTLRGKVTNIATTATGTKAGNLFKVESESNLTDKEASVLKYGLEGKFVLITGQKTYLSYFWDKFLGQR